LFLSVAVLSETTASIRVPLTLREPAHDSLIQSGIDLMHRGEYLAADSLLSALPDIPARGYFRGLVLAAKCGDIGDTSAVTAAATEWERLDRAGDDPSSPLSKDPQYGLYRGLSQLQLSYVANLRGGRIKSARLGRKAAKTLEPLAGYVEAAAALALFDYYKAQLLKGVAWLPFVSGDREGPLKRLEASILRSRYLKDLLETSLLWIYYDAGRYDAGLPAIRRFLARYPRNRPTRAMLADFQFRKGDLDSALAIHLALAAEYQDLQASAVPGTRIPIGYLCSVGNLAKIYAAKGQKDALARQLAVWNSTAHSGIIDWLPESLVREVGALKKENPSPKGPATR
jgi:tetratricopeptide (TPR) repeat protein